MTTSLLTDQYELTMLEASMKSGLYRKKSSFEVFCRALPPGRRYGVVGGIERVVQAISQFRFDPDSLDFLRKNRIVGEDTLTFLENYNFSGDVWAYDEGDLYFPYSPIMRIDAPLGEAMLLETVVLSILNFDSSIASAGARIVGAANTRSLIEMGSRRIHEVSAVSAARMAYIVGFAATSNLMAGRLYAIPTAGTVAHSFILAHKDEYSAFKAQIEMQGTKTTLLVDTYDIEEGIKMAVSVAGSNLNAIRIDSGDPSVESQKARQLLDSLGANNTKIVLSGDLDEFAIEALSSQPIDSFGVGTRLVTGSGAPTANFVYKLIAIETEGRSGHLLPVAKRSILKSNHGGRKTAARAFNENGIAIKEVLAIIGDSDLIGASDRYKSNRKLQKKIIEDGKVLLDKSLSDLRYQHTEYLKELGSVTKDISPGSPCIDTVLLNQDGTVSDLNKTADR